MSAPASWSNLAGVTVESSEFIRDARADLAAEMPEARTTGHSFAWVGKRPPGREGEVIAKYLSSSHWPFSPADGWQFSGATGDLRAVGRDEATMRLSDCLRRDLAYGADILDDQTASRLSTMFVALLSSDASWWTNLITESTDGRTRAASYFPLTDVTFDSGVIGLDSTSLAIAWVADED